MLTESMAVTPPTLYAAFGSKEELYREALARYRHLGRQAAAVSTESGSVFSMLEHHLRAAAQRFPDPDKPKGCMVAVGSLQCGADNRNAADAVASERRAGLAGFVIQLEQAKQRGELPCDTDADALACFYAAVYQGMSIQAIDGADTARLNALVDIALAAWPGRRPDGGRA